MKKLFVKKNLVHLWAILIFAALSLAYFAPVVFGDKSMGQGDVYSWRGMQQESEECFQQTGEHPDWTNMAFGGMPVTGGKGYNLYGKIFPKVMMLGMPTIHAGILFFYMIGVYILLCVMGCSPWISVMGAVAYAFSTYNVVIIDAGHANKSWAMACMAPIMAGLLLCFKGKYLWGSLLVLVFTGMHIMYSHQQITYYLLIILLSMAVAYGIDSYRKRQMKTFLKGGVVAVVMAVISLLPSLGSWLVTYDYSKDTMRGGAVLKVNPEGKTESTGLEKDYAFQWSYGKMESFTLLIPEIYGGSSHFSLSENSETYQLLRGSGQTAFAMNAPAYWGDQPFTSGPVYVGAVICLLFILGLFVVKGPEKWWLLAVTAISLILSWGRHLPGINNFLFEYLPLYNRFRTPSMALVIAELSMVILAALAVKTLVEEKDRRKYLKDFGYALGIVGGICLFFMLFGKSMFSFSGLSDGQLPASVRDALVEDRGALLVSSAWRSIVFVLIAGVFIWAYLKKGMKVSWLVSVLLVLVLVDLWTEDRKYVGEKNFYPARAVKVAIPTEIDNAILADKDPNYRVFNATVNTFNDASTSNFHKSVGGYSPIKMRRYQDIIDYHLSNGINVKVLNMLNTKYFIAPGSDGRPIVQRNVSALGHAWFVDSIRWVNSPDEEIVALYDFDPAHTAVIDTLWRPYAKLPSVTYPAPDSASNIRLIEYFPNKLTYTYRSGIERPAVFADVYYKIWKAYVDGQEVPLYRVNYILRGATLPEGEHTLVLECRNPYRTASLWISNTGSIVNAVVILTLLCALVWQGRRRQDGMEVEKDQ